MLLTSPATVSDWPSSSSLTSAREWLTWDCSSTAAAWSGWRETYAPSSSRSQLSCSEAVTSAVSCCVLISGLGVATSLPNRSNIEVWPLSRSSCARRARREMSSAPATISPRDMGSAEPFERGRESNAPALASDSRARRLSARASIRSLRSSTDSNGPLAARSAISGSTAARPTFLTVARPKRIALRPSAKRSRLKLASELFASGGSSLILSRAHSAAAARMRSELPAAARSTAAM